MARKSNTESKPVVSAGSPVSSSVKKTKRTTTRKSAHHKAAPVDSVPAPELENTPAPTATSPEVVAGSIANLSQAVAPEIDREAVARLAYSYWEQRGYQGGFEQEDWLRAEQELLARQA